MWCITNYLPCIIYALYYLLVTGIFISHFWPLQLIFPTTTYYYLLSSEPLWRAVKRYKLNMKWEKQRMSNEWDAYLCWVGGVCFFCTCDFCLGFYLSIPVLIKIQLLQLNICGLFLSFFCIWTQTVWRKNLIILCLIACHVEPCILLQGWKDTDKKCALQEQKWHRS